MLIHFYLLPLLNKEVNQPHPHLIFPGTKKSLTVSGKKLQQAFKKLRSIFSKIDLLLAFVKIKMYKDLERLPWCNLSCKLTGTEGPCCILRNSCVNHHHYSLSTKFYQTHFSHLNTNYRHVCPTNNVSSKDSKNSTETKSVLYELLSLESMP